MGTDDSSLKRGMLTAGRRSLLITYLLAQTNFEVCCEPKENLSSHNFGQGVA